ncbi:AlbA family DNA-binding domain-containing protein [Paenibacillus ihuae]|uniref:AlbA family DNA-binding domain-containing protein n=1 Tax=Paenibacillus ihuae TaxID=1232431 RepID=UPI0006D54A1E|nr:ATP-binding protein [Paenibacillus ihuae]
MRLNGKRIADLTAEDIGQLISNKVPESITLEYKEEGPDPSDAGKKEFLADLSAMANTNGGLLIFGIKEAQEDGKNAGYSEEVTGIKDPRNGDPVNVEQLKQFLDSVIRDNLVPRLSGIEYAAIHYDPDRLVFIIDVPRSLQAPHMIIFKNDSKFFKRTNTGKYQMDVREIREAMLRTHGWKESAEQFREVRIKAKHIANPSPTYDGTVLLHVIPLGDRENIDLKGKRQEMMELFPQITGRDTVTFNLDGLKKHSTSAEEYYYQIYRNGGMESCEVICYEKDDNGSWEVDLPLITNTALRHLHHYMEFAKSQNITVPFVVFLSVIHMGKALVRVRHIGKQPFAQGEDIILFPGVIIDENTANLPALMQSTFDILYQACGLESCNVYDSAGNYTYEYLR